MIAPAAGHCWTRRARPLLGTLVEVGVTGRGGGADNLVESAFAAIADVQACLSRFDEDSELSRFHALAAGESMRVGVHAAVVLQAAQALRDATAGLFDVSLGSAPHGWRCDGRELHKLDAHVRLDLGGIAKGYAVDHAIAVLQALGCDSGWVNAGGDVRVFGDVSLPLALRDEVEGGARPFASLHDGALATSHFDHRSRSQASAAHPVQAHVSVAAPRCLWADALTKVVAISGDLHHPELQRHDARAWTH
jgi:thiamine biosynthesis lipoprotein